MLNLNGFVEKYAEKNNLSKTASKEEILRFIESFKDITAESGGINLNGFIKSEIKEYKAKKGVNPRTQEKILIPAKTKIKVSALPTFAKMLED